MPPLLTARQLFIVGVVLTAVGSALALVTDGWLALIFESADFPHAVAGSIAILVREIAMTLGLVLVGVSFLARRLEEGPAASSDSHGWPAARQRCETSSMDIEQWWPRLSAQTRERLTAHNGEVVPAAVVSEITDAGGGPAAGAWWVGDSDSDGISLSDAAIDWIDEAANGEH